MKIQVQGLGEVEAEQIDFDIIKESVNEYKLRDGTIMKVRSTPTTIYRAKDRYTPNGEPLYLVTMGPLHLMPLIPEHLKKPE